MAATLTDTNELTFVSFPIEKTETTPDGDLIVYGKATDGSVDSDDQIVDTDFSAKAIADWLSSGANVRVQHNSQRDPAGVGIEANTGPDGTWVKSLVVEPVAKRLVEKGALRAYSVGIARPKIVRDSVARGGRIVDGQIVEISLVDRPANKNCGIQLVKADKDGHAEWVGKAFGTDLLTKSESEGGDLVSLNLPKDVSVSFSPADLAKLLEHRRIAEKRATEADAVKRDMDPDTGGGVDRDQIPAADFAGRDRSFPIVTPGDVSDAASSIGRAGTDNYSPDTLRDNIISIARRKGPEYVQELPQAWRNGAASSKSDAPGIGKAKAKKPKKALPGAAPAFDGHDSDGDGNDADTAASKPAATKGMKDCTGCGKAYHADSKMKRCEACGKKLPKAAAKSAATVSAPVEAEAVKGDTYACLGCGKTLDGDDRFCSGCGKANPNAEKTAKPTPDGGAVGSADIQPVPAHREPDGPFIEALEHDAGLPTDPDGPYLKAAMRLKSLGVPQDLGATHDLLCAAYHPDTAAKAHPTHAVTGIDVGVWQQKALDAAVSAPLEEAGRMTQLWQHAVTIKSVPADIVDDLRREAHKAFQDANPGPGGFPQPTELSPARFNRPYLTAGRARPGTDYGSPNSAKVPTGHLQAGDFNRGPLSAGHAEDSPANKSGSVIEPAPLPPGMGRTYYTNTQRDSARSAMAAMHDHIAQTFPDLCPMGGPGVGGQPPEGARPVPTPAGMGKAEGGGLSEKQRAKRLKKAQKAYNDARAELGLEGHDFTAPAVTKAASVTAAPVGADVIKSAVTEATGSLLTELADLRKTVDALAELPDPRETPFRGLATQTTTKAAGLPVGAPTAAGLAEQAQLSVMSAMREQALNSPDPAQREAAWAQLYQMTGLKAQ